tara:strand:+ start:113 stop:400 length:288 start_codon:yes stop_codon:yes gene_type:complete
MMIFYCNNVYIINLTKGYYKMSICITGKEKTLAFRKLTLLNALEIEVKTGLKMTSKMPSAYSIIKKEFNLKGNKKDVLRKFIFLLLEEKILVLKS